MNTNNHEGAEETTPEAVPAPETNQENANSQKVEESIDHSAELEELKKKQELSKEQNKANALERLRRQGKTDESQDDSAGQSSIDTDSIRNEIRKEIEQAKADTRKEVIRETVRERIISNSKTTAEAELALWHFENSIVPTGNPSEDAETSILLANKKRYKQELSEAHRALVAKQNLGNGSGAGQKEKVPTKPKISDKDKKFMQSWGVTEEDMSKPVFKGERT